MGGLGQSLPRCPKTWEVCVHPKALPKDVYVFRQRVPFRVAQDGCLACAVWAAHLLYIVRPNFRGYFGEVFLVLFEAEDTSSYLVVNFWGGRFGPLRSG